MQIMTNQVIKFRNWVSNDIKRNYVYFMHGFVRDRN